MLLKVLKNKSKVKRQKTKRYHNRSAHPLPPLEVGQEVRVAPLQRGKSWQAGTLLKQLSDRSYLVKTGTETIRRNRQFLKPQEQSAVNVVPEIPSKSAEPEGVPTPVLPTQGGNSPNLPVPAPDPGSDPAPDPVSYAAPDPVPAKRTRTRIIVSRKI